MSRLVERLFARRMQLPPPSDEVDTPAVPEDLLRRLRLESSRVADAAMSGFHASAQLGRGVEFAGFRAYAPGDDLRLLDRRRSMSEAGLLVRQYEVERDRALLVTVDGSESMGPVRGGPDAKRRWGNVVGAALVRIAAAQGDVACAAVFGEHPVFGGFSRGKAAFDRATEVLVAEAGGAGEGAHGGGRTDGRARSLESAARRVAIGRGWFVVLSDFLDEAPPLFALLAEARSRGARAIAVRLETPEERDFPFDGAARLRDPETGARVETFGPVARVRYLEARARHRDRVATDLVARGVVLVDAWTDRPPEVALLATVEAIASQRG